MHKNLTPINVLLTNFRQNDINVCTQIQKGHRKVNLRKRCSHQSDVQKNPKDANHSLNKWWKVSSKERINMLNNHDVWSHLGIDRQGTISILRISTVVSNRPGATIIRGFPARPWELNF